MTTDPRHLKEASGVRVKCAIPDCTIYSKPPEEGQPPLCSQHREIFKVVMWVLPHIQFRQIPAPQPPPAAKLLVPQLVSPGGVPLRRP